MAKPEYYYGIHSVESLLVLEPERVLTLFALKGRDDHRLKRIFELADPFGISIQQASKDSLEKLAHFYIQTSFLFYSEIIDNIQCLICFKWIWNHYQILDCNIIYNVRQMNYQSMNYHIISTLNCNQGHVHLHPYRSLRNRRA